MTNSYEVILNNSLNKDIHSIAFNLSEWWGIQPNEPDSKYLKFILKYPTLHWTKSKPFPKFRGPQISAIFPLELSL